MDLSTSISDLRPSFKLRNVRVLRQEQAIADECYGIKFPVAQHLSVVSL